MVVDDDDAVRNLYLDVFREAGFEVSEAKDGLEALGLINQNCPDLVFTGIIMPNMDGFALTEQLNKNVATASIPVVFSSHLGRQEDQKKAKEIGVKDFIILGMTPVLEVVRRVKMLLQTTEYLVDINVQSLDAQKLARDLNLNLNFLCSESGGQRLALRLRVKDAGARSFEADFICV